MKIHHDGVYSSVIDIVEGRMIVTNNLIEKKEKKKQSFWLLLKMSWLYLGFEIWKSYEKRGIIKQGIDFDGRDKWDRMWWNGCDNKGCLWYWWLEEMIWWIERENREIKNCYWK